MSRNTSRQFNRSARYPHLRLKTLESSSQSSSQQRIGPKVRETHCSTELLPRILAGLNRTSEEHLAHGQRKRWNDSDQRGEMVLKDKLNNQMEAANGTQVLPDHNFANSPNHPQTLRIVTQKSETSPGQTSSCPKA